MATRLGLAMRSINDDEEAAIVLGVNVRAVQVAAFTIGGAFAGLSGALYAHNFSFVEAQYFNALLSIYVLLFVLIGGTQTAWGPLAGSLFFTLLPELFRIGGSWRYIVFGVLIVADDGVCGPKASSRATSSGDCRLGGRAAPRGPRMDAEPALALDHVTKRFGGLAVVRRHQLRACRRARASALIGPNGAGKTTLFNLVSGVYAVDSRQHHARRAGRSMTLPPRKRVRAGLARTFQNIRLMPHLSVIENIMLGQHAPDLRSLLSAARLATQRRGAPAGRGEHAARRDRRRSRRRGDAACRTACASASRWCAR